jgi:uncharacterized protein
MGETKFKPCPTCRRPVAWEYNPFRPFCSERCKLLDLGNWATGKYSVPSDEPLEIDGEEVTDSMKVPPDDEERGGGGGS